MAQIFGRSANSIAKASMIALAVFAGGGLFALDQIYKSPYVRYTGVPREQPVPFSHKHHTNMGLDCRYCHTTVEDAAVAGVPPTRVCMNCHTQIFPDAPTLAPVRESWATGKPIEWTRVHDLPDFVYFNHSIHVNKGVSCKTCHGPVNQMPLMWRDKPLFMSWCIECHRNPAKFIGPREEVFNMKYVAPANHEELGKKLVEEYHVQSANDRLLDCWICHR